MNEEQPNNAAPQIDMKLVGQILEGAMEVALASLENVGRCALAPAYIRPRMVTSVDFPNGKMIYEFDAEAFERAWEYICADHGEKDPADDAGLTPPAPGSEEAQN